MSVSTPWTTEAEFWEYIPKEERDKIPREDFAWPDAPGGPKYPCDTQDHLDACAKLIGDAPEDQQASIKSRAKSIAKRHGFSIPDSWKEDKVEESTTAITSSTFRPAQKIATIPVRWLKYNAESLNRRMYPKAICDQTYQAALRKLANEDSLPITCFVSHEAANGNVNTELVGRVPHIWQEGSEFWANIDIADTSTGRDMLGLFENKSLCAVSMRLLGVDLRYDPAYKLPIVVAQEGVEPELLGIDLTTRPGLADTGRIQQVLYESSTEAQQPYTESFPIDISIASKEAPMQEIPIYLQILTEGVSSTSESKAAHMRVHDHLAGVLDDCVKPMHGNESAGFIASAQLSEEGRALAMKHSARLAAAHDESAKQCGMACEGAYNEALGIAPSDTDGDGDNPAQGNDPDNDGESAKGEKNLMTEQEAMALLAAKGYSVAPPKTELQILQEQVAEQKRQLEELRQTNTLPPQRQTQSLSSMHTLQEDSYQPEPMYADGMFLQGPLHPKHWNALSGHGTSQLRDVPWPQDVDPWAAVHEMAPIVALGICEQQARMLNSDVSFYIKPDEVV